MAIQIRQITPYTGDTPVPGQAPAVFSQNAQDQLTFMNNMADELVNTISDMNDSANEMEANAISASQSAAVAEVLAIMAGYQGLWPDTGGSALKGETYQTQVGGVPTGNYYTALQNTTVDPIGDNVNWLEHIKADTFFIKHMLFKGMPMSAVGPSPDPDIWLPSGRVELQRADYPTVFEIVSASGFFTDQATIDADPRTYAGHWGTGDGTTTFTTDDWALMMHIKVAGGYGSAGATKEDHIQNMTGSYGNTIDSLSNNYTEIALPNGVFSPIANDVSTFKFARSNSAIRNVGVSFDASRVARTDTYTDTMGLFLDHYRVIPKGVFSYD